MGLIEALMGEALQALSTDSDLAKNKKERPRLGLLFDMMMLTFSYNLLPPPIR